MAFRTQAQDLWSTVYTCKNGNNVEAILMQRESLFQLHGIKCLDKECYLISENYDYYNLQQVTLDQYHGVGISLIKNIEEKTIDIVVKTGNFPSGVYACDFK